MLFAGHNVIRALVSSVAAIKQKKYTRKCTVFPCNMSGLGWPGRAQIAKV